MAILTLICPGCEKSTLMDDEDDKHYCMHCGLALMEPATAEAVPIEPLLEAALRASGALGDDVYAPKDYSGESWHPEVEAIEQSLIEGDSETAADRLAALLDANPDASPDIEACMRDILAGWMVDCIVEGDAYSGGATDIARLIEEYGEESGPNVLIASLFYAIAQTRELVAAPEDAAIVAESLFNLLLDYPEVEPDLRIQLEMCTDFMHVSGTLIDEADAIATDEDEMEEVRDWIYALQDFVRMFGDKIYDACDVGEERLDQLADLWLDEDISTIGANVRDAACQYLDGEIDEDAAKRMIGEYLEMYTGLESH